MRTRELFDLDKSMASPFLDRFEYPNEAVRYLYDFVLNIGKTLDRKIYSEIFENVWVAKSAEIFSSAYITGPAIIGEGSAVRHCAFIRGSVLIGRECVVGNSCELKNSILFDRVQVPHFNYVGDSILGYGSHMGAGAVTSNVKSDKSEVTVTQDGFRQNSGMRKLGAMLGDFAEIGCGTVLCPGSIVGRNTIIYPNSVVRGVIPSDSIYKSHDKIVIKRQHMKEE